MFLRLIALAAVGGAAWLFMRPQFPILPPGTIGKKRKSMEKVSSSNVKKAGLTKGAAPTQVSPGRTLPPSSVVPC